MQETQTFPVDYCESCERDVLVARDLDDADEWVRICTRCATPLAARDDSRAYSAASLQAIGYTFEHLSGGCGSGGCGSCGAG